MLVDVVEVKKRNFTPIVIATGTVQAMLPLQAAVSRAELGLERSTIRAPFDAHIITRNANVGSQLAPGTELGRCEPAHFFLINSFKT